VGPVPIGEPALVIVFAIIDDGGRREIQRRVTFPAGYGAIGDAIAFADLPGRQLSTSYVWMLCHFRSCLDSVRNKYQRRARADKAASDGKEGQLAAFAAF
jgi:hypothetical protein